MIGSTTRASTSGSGSPTEPREAGYVRVCTNADCGQHHFPRSDPAIIVLVESDDRCLLGRKPHWPKELYSTVAGFVEPGECIEQAVIREVAAGESVGATSLLNGNLLISSLQSSVSIDGNSAEKNGPSDAVARRAVIDGWGLVIRRSNRG